MEIFLFVLLFLVLLALARAARNRKRIEAAEARWRRRADALQHRVAELEKRREGVKEPDVGEVTEVEVEEVAEEAEEVAPPPPPEPLPRVVEPKPPPAPPLTPAAPRPARKPSLEERIGGRWFNWVGILAILFGVAYAMKYSFDRGWITPRTRFHVGLGFGALLLAAGVLAQNRRYHILARGFWGGGIGVFFLVFFAGFQLLFDLHGDPIISRGMAFLGMAATVVVGVAIAVIYNTRTAAVLSALGGYLTPVLLSTGEPDQIFLFTYLTILTAGLLVTGCWRRWAFMRVFTFAIVVSYFAGWWLVEGVGQPGPMVLYTSLMFILFSAELVAWSTFRRGSEEGWSFFLLGLNTTLHVLVGLKVLGDFFPAYQGLFLLATAGFHLGGALLVRRFHGEDRVFVLFLCYAAAALFLLVPVFEERTSEHWMPIAWAVQGAALFLAAERWGGRHTRAWGYGALGLAAARLLAWDTPRTLFEVDPYLPFWSARGLAYGVAIAAFAVGCWRTLRRERAGPPVAPAEHLAATGLWIVALALPAVLLSLELAQALDTYVAPRFAERPREYQHQAAHWMTLLWAAYATLVATVTGRRGAQVLRTVALAFGAFVLAKYVIRDLTVTYVTQATPLVNSRFAVTAALAACLFWIAREFSFLKSVGRAAAHVLLVAGLGMEWVDFCHEWEIGEGFWAGAPLLGLTLLLAGYGTGLALRGAAVLVRTGVAFVALAGVKWLVLDLPSVGTVSLFQLRVVAAAAAAAAGFFVAGRRLAGPFADGVRVLAHLVVVAALSAETRDLFERHDWSADSAVSVVLGGGFAVTAVWALYGLGALWVGHRRQRPHLRAFGLAFVGFSLAVGLGMILPAEQAKKLALNSRLLGLVFTVVALLWGAELYRRKELSLARPLRFGNLVEGAVLGAPLTLAGHGLAMLLLTLEAADYFRRTGTAALGLTWIDAEEARQLSFSLIWAVYAVGMVVGGFLRQFRPVRLMALFVLVVTILKVFLFDLSFLENPYRILSFLVLGAILVAVSFLYQKYKEYLV